MNPWEECPEMWPTQASYFQWMRGQMRKVWCRHPVRNKFIRLNQFKAPIGRVIKKTGKRQEILAGKCCCCGNTLPKGELQVDHKDAAGSFKGWYDFELWMHGLMHVCVADLQWMCTKCHAIKSYADRWDLTFDEAALEKRVIAFSNTTAKEQIACLGQLCPGHTATNAEQRKDVYRNYLREVRDAQTK